MKTVLRSAVILACAAGAATAQAPEGTAGSDSAAIMATVNGFHAALAAGDSAAAVRLLAPDLVVAEAGGIENHAEYLAHHLGGDMEFARAVPSERVVTAVTEAGGVAWVTSTSTTRGTFRDRAVDSRGAELMVLTRSPDGWRIRAVHWSSRRAPARP